MCNQGIKTGNLRERCSRRHMRMPGPSPSVEVKLLTRLKLTDQGCRKLYSRLKTYSGEQADTIGIGYHIFHATFAILLSWEESV